VQPPAQSRELGPQNALLVAEYIKRWQIDHGRHGGNLEKRLFAGYPEVT
jgi:hypothetical protein